eukprot:1414861-Amphidinium_carterae.1
MPLDTAVTVEEPETIVEWNRPKAECFYDEYTGIKLPSEGVIHARHEKMAYMQHLGPGSLRGLDLQHNRR